MLTQSGSLSRSTVRTNSGANGEAVAVLLVREGPHSAAGKSSTTVSRRAPVRPGSRCRRRSGRCAASTVRTAPAVVPAAARRRRAPSSPSPRPARAPSAAAMPRCSPPCRGEESHRVHTGWVSELSAGLSPRRWSRDHQQPAVVPCVAAARGTPSGRGRCWPVAVVVVEVAQRVVEEARRTRGRDHPGRVDLLDVLRARSIPRCRFCLPKSPWCAQACRRPSGTRSRPSTAAGGCRPGRRGS